MYSVGTNEMWSVHLIWVVFFVNFHGGFAGKPHVIMIIADDLGWNDVGFHGSNQIPTPNIDALAYNGAILNRFYTQHTCTPSRSALMTGNYPIRTGMQGFPIKGGENRSLPENMPTLPQRMKELGYKTHLVGKWHLGHGHRNSTPNMKGFDSFYGYWNGLISYVDYKLQFGSIDGDHGVDLHDNLSPAEDFQGKYATHLFTQKTVSIIEQHPENEPLFLILSHLAGHTGNEENGNSLTAADLDETNRKFAYISDKRRRNYTDIVFELDKSVGQVVQTLSAKKMLQNSVIIYLHDNGAQTSGGLHENFGSNWPLRGQKFSLFEGAVRGTCVVYAPSIPEGYINNELMHITDWLPTLYALGGGDLSRLGQIDGVNQWPSIQSNVPSNRTDVLVNIDEVLQYSSYISYGGQYKLVNGSYPGGQYDGYTGETGRGSEVPVYNPEDVLQSTTNVLINNLKANRLNSSTVTRIRNQLDISACRPVNYIPEWDCKNLCLFDLFKDPCETSNIIMFRPDLGRELSENMHYYWGQLVPQTLNPVDEKANPKLCDGHYFNWLEEDGCKSHGSGGGVKQFTKLTLGMYFVLARLL